MKLTVGNTGITDFDVIVIGSGAGGSAAAHVLAKNGKKVLVLEAGANYFAGLDDPSPKALKTLFSHDELKLSQRGFIHPDVDMEPRTFRISEHDGARTFIGDVNNLPKTVGGAAAHADLKTPRFMRQDFRMGQLAGKISGTTFADWPVDYDELESFYEYVEKTIGVQGKAGANPFEEKRRTPFPMAPGAPMYAGMKLAGAAVDLGYQPFPYPCAVNSVPYDGRPACVDCGVCSGYGCPNSSKGAPPVTTLRKALLTGNCLLVSETRAIKLTQNGNSITGVVCLDPKGKKVTYKAGTYILAASPIESARLLLNSEPNGLGNSSGMVGRNLTFHYQTFAVGIFDERIHGHRGRSVSHGMADFRGSAQDYVNHPLGGIIEFAAAGDVIQEAIEYSLLMGFKGHFLRMLMQQSPMRDRLAAMIMQGEDAPQFSNQVDLDPDYKDIDGIPVPRVTYKPHKFELHASHFYQPKMLKIMKAAGAKFAFIAPSDAISKSAHVMGTLRFGKDPKTSVCDKGGRFHDFENLYAADASLFPTSSGLNPALTIMTLGTYVAARMLFADSPEKALI